MIAYRIGSSTYPLLDGSGAASSGDARWNSSGRYVIYAAEHYATALLEKADQLTYMPASIFRMPVSRKCQLMVWRAGTRTTRRPVGDSVTVGTTNSDC